MNRNRPQGLNLEDDNELADVELL